MQVQGVLFTIQKFRIHDGPGIRTAVFFKGAPSAALRSNPESQTPGLRPADAVGDPSLGGKFHFIEETLETCLQDRAFYEESGGGVTLSGGEVLFRLILPQNPPPHPGDPRLQRQPRGRRKLCAPPQGRPPEPIRSNPRLSINLGKTSTPPWG